MFHGGLGYKYFLPAVKPSIPPSAAKPETKMQETKDKTGGMKKKL